MFLAIFFRLFLFISTRSHPDLSFWSLGQRRYSSLFMMASSTPRLNDSSNDMTAQPPQPAILHLDRNIQLRDGTCRSQGSSRQAEKAHSAPRVVEMIGHGGAPQHANEVQVPALRPLHYKSQEKS
ncbi:hypothetical protein J3F83DRAFT_729793 [Trichoderma novae-zelandiae]